MKKLTLLVAFTMLLNLSYAGGLLTNSNQSAQYVRMLARNAGLEIDAVFYNPAGLVKMENGWHFAFHNQTILQTRAIDSEFPLLNDGYYEGDTKIPIFPNVYAVYKKDKWAFSLGAGPVAGGGTAEFKDGLPSLEIPVTKFGAGLKTVAPLLGAYGIPAAEDNGYSMDMAFDASSTYWGIQLGATYAINDKFSVYGGARLLPSINTYEGSITNIEVPTSAGNLLATEYLAMANPVLTGAITNLDQGAIGMQGAIDAGIVDPNGSVQDPTLLELLAAFGITDATNQQSVYYMQGTSESLQGLRDANVSDKTVKTKQKGFGFTPIIGFNYSPNDDWTFAAKYEFKTNLTLENETEVDDLGLFPDGAEGDYDVPAILSTGIAYRGVDWLEAQLSYNIYFDKAVDFGYNVRYKTSGELVEREIDNHGHEVTMGFQFNVTDKFAFSVGGLALRTGVADSYQSDFSYSNDANGIGGGIMWKLTDKLVLDAGVSKIWYKDETITFTDVGSYDETYGKKSLSVAVGLSYSIF